LIRPDAQLRKLIATASPEQNARAMAKARDWWNMCRKLEVTPAEASRVLKEALEMEISGEADVADAGKCTMITLRGGTIRKTIVSHEAVQ
jgi:hypothetical protein